MTILAIDSSGMTASAALLQNGKVLAEYTVNNKMTHSQTLLPMVDEICRMVQMEKKSLDAVAIAAGPGSFTGLRIGSATVKGLALALNIPVVEVPTLEGLAYRFAGSDCLIVPLMDARRDQVYTGLYRWDTAGITVVEAQMAVSVEKLIDRINAQNESVILLGDGVDAYETILRERIAVPYRFALPHLRYQSAGAIAVCAEKYIAEGRTVSGADHKPDYLRVSQAERERAQRLKEEENAGNKE